MVDLFCEDFAFIIGGVTLKKMYVWLALIGVALILTLLFSLTNTNSEAVIFDGNELLEITDVHVMSVRGGRISSGRYFVQ